MKKFILGLTLLTSVSSFANTTLNVAAGDQFEGVDSKLNLACSVVIEKLNIQGSKLKVDARTDISIFSVYSTLADDGHKFKSTEEDTLYRGLSSNLIVENGAPKSLDVTEASDGYYILNCSNLKKVSR